MNFSLRNKLLFCIAAASGSGAATAQISFQAAANEPLQALRPDWVASGDFDGDGDQDLAVSTGSLSGGGGPDYVEILLNNGAGDFAFGQQIVVGNSVSTAAVVAARFDADADIDLAVSLHDTGVVQMLVNNGAGVFSLGSSVQTGGSEPRQMAAGDIDNDGDVDLITSNRASDNLRIVLNNGAGVLSLGALIGVGIEPRHVVLARLNGDAFLDIAVAAHDSARVDVLPGVGGGSFGAIQPVSMPFNEKPSGMTAGDLDGDGDVDLATTLENNGVAGYFVVMGNSGSATFSALPYASNGLNPNAVVAADLDGDGDLDLAAADEDSNHVSAIRNTGGLGFSVAVTFPVGTHPTSIVAAELDGNGSIDLATANRDSNNVSVLRNTVVSGPVAYCTAGTSAAGCVGTLSASSNPNVGHSNSTVITASGVDGQRSGLFFYGLAANSAPWCWNAPTTSTLCVKAPLQRSQLFNSGGATGTCSGSFALNWNGFQVSNPGMQGSPWTAGEQAFVQGWYRDPQACRNTQLTNAVRLTYVP